MFKNFKKRFEAREEYRIAKAMLKNDNIYFIEPKQDKAFSIGYLCAWYEWALHQIDICKELKLKKIEAFWSDIVVRADKACREYYGEDLVMAYAEIVDYRKRRDENKSLNDCQEAVKKGE